MVAETGVMLIPGNFFDMQKQYLRFGYGRAGFAEALQHLEQWLASRPLGPSTSSGAGEF
ncbi:MAG TPA: hypothetical protein PKC25_10090 [Candidatus Rifleibacterium sp.]|nr:hypothetical protein [Candidatus Rifleibacterium sp.]